MSEPKPIDIGDVVAWTHGDGDPRRGVVYGVAVDMTPRSENEGRRTLSIRGLDGVGYANVPAEHCAVAPREDD